MSDWIRPPAQLQLPELDHLSDNELLQAARDSIPAEHIQRLQALLDAQRERTLSEDEQREAVSLVEQEDLLTLRKARALFLYFATTAAAGIDSEQQIRGHTKRNKKGAACCAPTKSY